MSGKTNKKISDRGFSGISDGKFDKKLRVQMPSQVYKSLKSDAQSVIVTRGRNPEHAYLEIWNTEDWDKMYETLMANVPPDSMRYLTAGYLGWGIECALDSQQRLVVPKKIREWAELEPGCDVVWLGGAKWVELWAKEKFAKQDKPTHVKSHELLQKFDSIL